MRRFAGLVLLAVLSFTLAPAEEPTRHARVGDEARPSPETGETM
jgi:hypothetical protein